MTYNWRWRCALFCIVTLPCSCRTSAATLLWPIGCSWLTSASS